MENAPSVTPPGARGWAARAFGAGRLLGARLQGK